MRLVQNVQIVIILRDILINFPDFIESLKKASPQPSPEGKGVTKNESLFRSDVVANRIS